jgi:hypothetical protein
VELSVNSDVARNLQVTRLARLLRRLNLMFSVHRLGIDTAGLKIEHETLLDLARAYMRQAFVLHDPQWRRQVPPAQPSRD